jgi:hypothetical protein
MLKLTITGQNEYRFLFLYVGLVSLQNLNDRMLNSNYYGWEDKNTIFAWFYGRETWSLIPREKRRLSTSEERVLRRMF